MATDSIRGTLSDHGRVEHSTYGSLSGFGWVASQRGTLSDHGRREVSIRGSLSATWAYDFWQFFVQRVQ